MKERRVRFTATANQHLDRERAWWAENRDHQELFATEIESAVAILAIFPSAGAPYEHNERRLVRRHYLPKVGCHIYYTFDDDEVIVRAIWGARLERGPRIAPLG